MKLTLAFLFVLSVILTGCNSAPSYSSSSGSSSSSSSSSDSSKLTTEKAQDAIDRFAKANGTGRIRIKGGVREIPAQNSATAEVDVDEWTDNERRQFKGKPAVAGFSHYSDGRWALTEFVVRLPESYGSVTWKPTIEVR